MGYFCEDYVIVKLEAYDEKAVTLLDAWILLHGDLPNKHGDPHKIIHKFDTPINGGVQYFIMWDGSKEGWDTSDEGDRIREGFIEAAKAHAKYPHIYTIQRPEDGEAVYEEWEAVE